MTIPTTSPVLPILLLIGVLAFAVIRPRRLPEVVGALPAALLVVWFGYESPHAAWHEASRLFPIVVFLAAVLAIASGCARAGLFDAAGSLLSRASRGSSNRLLLLVFAAASLTTIVLSLDATVVLLTPVVIRAARNVRVDPAPSAFAAGHLSNSASLLLPVSNLTNLLAFSATGLSFVSFGLHMAVPTALAIAGEYVALRLWFRRRLSSTVLNDAPSVDVVWPRFAAAVVVLVLIGFGVTSPLGVDPMWVALAGAVVLVVQQLITRSTSVGAVARSINIDFCLFVLCLAVVVHPVASGVVGDVTRDLMPSSSALPALLAIAAVAAVLANLVNNIPATLVLLGVLGATEPTRVLAVLVGVNIGPNLTYVGSLATLLWRRATSADDVPVALGEFTGVGALSVVLCLVLATCGLWLTS